MPRPRPGLLIDGHVPENPWYEGGLCLSPHRGLVGTDLTNLFFSEDEDDIVVAKQICSGCHIRAVCLETALAFKEPEGVWGGLTPQERRSLVRKRKRGAA